MGKNGVVALFTYFSGSTIVRNWKIRLPEK